MTLDSQIQFIQHLKRQPKHSQVGPIGDVEQALKKLYESYKQGGGEILRLNVFGTISDELNKIVRDLTIVQDLNQGLADGFNINVGEAGKLGAVISKLSGELGISGQKAKQYITEQKSLFGSQTKFFNQQNQLFVSIVQQNEKLRNQLQLSAEDVKAFDALQLQLMDNYKLAFGDAAEAFADVAAQFQKTYGYAGGLTDILDGMAELGAKNRTVFGRIPESLGLALIKTKALGVGLSTITEGAKGFLDIEQAIANELEFQILSGKELTTLNGESLTVAMQQAVYQQDANKQVELLTGFVKKYGDELRTNVHLQDLAATTFGMQIDDLFTIMERMSSINQTQKSIGGEFKDMFTTSVDGSIRMIDNFDRMVKAEDKRALTTQINDEIISKYVEGTAEAAANTEKTNANIMSAADATLNATVKLSNFAATLPGALSAASAGMGAIGTLSTMMANPGSFLRRKDYQTMQGTGEDLKTGNDLFIPATSGNVISGPLGSFALNPKDDILAAPNIRNTVNGDSSGVASAVVSALKGMSFHVTNVFDGQKVKSSLTILDQSTLNNTNII